MLATQNINTLFNPASLNYFGENKSDFKFQKNLKLRCDTKVQAAVSGLSLNTEEIIASSQNLSWQNVSAYCIKHLTSGGEARLLSKHCVALQLENQLEIEVSTESGTIKQVLRPGELMILPVGSLLRQHCQAAGATQTLYLFLEPAYLRLIAASYKLARKTTLDIAVGVRDEQLRHLSLALLYELNNENHLGHLYAETLANALALQIVRCYSRFQEVNLHQQGGMAAFKLRKALEFIDENLEREEELSLHKVAEKVGMSYFHFSRTFKQSMGISPNNYIVARRIEFAKKLLAQSDSPIADIALQVGFASQSHFTTMFRRLTGTTPKIFRRTL